MRKRLLGILMALVMVIGLMPATALAAMDPTGPCGSNATYELDTNGKLTISGSGAISASAFQGRTDIETVVIEEGITSIGNNAFRGCSSLVLITIPASVTAINSYAFYGCSKLTTVTYLGTTAPTLEARVFLGSAVEEVNVPAAYEGGSFAGKPVVRAENAEVAVTGVTLDKATAELKVGETATLTATVTPDDATDKTVTWTSSDASVATVENGVITAVGAGTATITATAGDKTATCEVTVKAASSGKKTKKYDVVIKQADNGDIEVDDDYAKRGQEITITVDPDKGYELDELTITDIYGDEVDYDEGKKDNTFVFEMPKADVTIEASFEKVSSADEDDKDEQEVVPDKEEEDTSVNGGEEKFIKLTIDQKIAWVFDAYVVNDVVPVIRNERTMLPIRFIAEILDSVVTWDEAAQTVSIEKGDIEMEIYIGQSFALVNGEPVQLDSPAFIENDRTYLPLRFVAENLGAKVIWDGTAQTVTIFPTE